MSLPPCLGTSHIALNRVGKPEEISELVLYLAGDESAFTTGSSFVIDGGETAGLAHNVAASGIVRASRLGSRQQESPRGRAEDKALSIDRDSTELAST